MSFHKTKRTMTLGSRAGWYGPLKSPRVSISWPPELLKKIAMEAYLSGIPFAEVVRRRMRASYLVPVRQAKRQ